jgi:tetratricopeptide (TPR) repeat protein
VKALLYTLVLGGIILGSIILMERFNVTQPPRSPQVSLSSREPIASGAPVEISKLSPEEFADYSIAELYETGVEFLEQWHVPEARAVFEHVIKQDSSFTRAYLKLAECHTDPLMFNESSIGHSLTLARRTAGPDTSYLAAMEDLYLDADYASAIDAFKRVIRTDADDTGAHYQLALAYAMAGRLREARTAIEALLERDESHGRARALLVECLVAEGRVDDAEQLAKDLASLYPGEPYPYTLLARVELRLGKIADAIEFCNNALNMDQRYPQAILARGYLYSEAGNHEAARVSFQKLLMFDAPILASAAWDAIAYIDFLSGNFDDAVDGMDEAIRLAHSAGSSLRTAATLFKLVTYLCELGQGDAAQSVLAKWVAVTGAVPAQFGKLRLDIFHGDLKAAAAQLELIGAAGEWRQLMDLLDIDYNELKALASIKERKYREAIALLTSESVTDTSYYFLGFASFQSGFAEQASAHFKRALSRRARMTYPYHGDPVVFVQSLFYLAETNLAIGDTAGAQAAYRRFLDCWGNASWELQAVARAREKLEALAAVPE